MNGLKQRIIGALVLVSLAVIFVPMMFDEPHSERQSSTIQIPEEPPFPEVEMPEPETTEPPEYRLEELDTSGADDAAQESAAESATNSATDSAAQNAVPAEAPQPADTADTADAVASEPAGASGSDSGSNEVSEAPEPAREKQEPVSAEFTRSLEGAWVVQLGSFGSEDNATRLREKVQEKGYSSHLQRISRGGTELTRVFSGPFAEKAEAERAKQALDKAFGLNSLVTTGGN